MSFLPPMHSCPAMPAPLSPSLFTDRTTIPILPSSIFLRVKKPKPKKTALERLRFRFMCKLANIGQMAPRLKARSLQKRTDEQLVVVQNLTAKINDKKAKWAAELARDLEKLRSENDKHKNAAALTTEGLAASLNADNEAMLEAAVPDASPTPGAGTTHKRVRNADSGVGSSVDSV
ncbi:hypothetical protein QR685DRAFT_586975 [Neurospora intermedia]|uniref:Uncharacterized protein n=1 Tax=Neurospora intermedia TaxID=5142 RepID=A0ABR3DBX7_NEUIN